MSKSVVSLRIKNPKPLWMEMNTSLLRGPMEQSCTAHTLPRGPGRRRGLAAPAPGTPTQRRVGRLLPVPSPLTHSSLLNPTLWFLLSCWKRFSRRLLLSHRARMYSVYRTRASSPEGGATRRYRCALVSGTASGGPSQGQVATDTLRRPEKK